jgi:hypothetical protein
MCWLGWDQFERDPGCYTSEVLEGELPPRSFPNGRSLADSSTLALLLAPGQDFWIGCGKLLVAGCYYPGVTERTARPPSLGLATPDGS